MNEIQIIQKQLATERLHFSEVANACAAALGNEVFAPAGEFAAACADYFAFAVSRFEAGSAAQKLGLARAGTSGAASGRWREFLAAFDEESRKHFGAVDALLTRNLPVTQWRSISRIDADSIFEERTLHGRVKAALPPGSALSAGTSPAR